MKKRIEIGFLTPFSTEIVARIGTDDKFDIKPVGHARLTIDAIGHHIPDQLWENLPTLA